MGKRFTKLAMSKPVGKILDSKIGKGMVSVGNAVKKIVKAPGNLIAGTMKKEDMMAKKKDMMNRANAPVGAQGGTNKGEYKPSSFRYGIQKRKIV